MTKDRSLQIINNVLEWASEHDDEFMHCLIYAMDLTRREIEELGLADYVEEQEVKI